jgi:hypothetical protein
MIRVVMLWKVFQAVCSRDKYPRCPKTTVVPASVSGPQPGEPSVAHDQNRRSRAPAVQSTAVLIKH